ncbi:MAG: ribose-phosphate pyrophosphokinase [Chitinispirillaceae bacterium]|nr:ribose-phosphate pyrophosphokinase [Chitinispirillaceae bacterium]
MEFKNRALKQFITPESFLHIRKQDLSGPNGWLLFVACNSGIDLAMSVKKEYESMLAENGSELVEIPLLGSYNEPITRVFSDTETCPRLTEHVAGSNAYIFQCAHERITHNTVNENIQQLLQVVRTLRAHRARTITVVTPYAPYSRQDKPSFLAREATLASLFVDQLKIAGAQTHLTYHPHALSLYGFYEPEMMLVALNGLGLFTEIFESFRGLEEVVAVSTDAGGAKNTVHFSEVMNIPYAIANKFRPGKDRTNLLGIIGDLSGKKIAIISDDETVTGSSIANATRWLFSNFGVKEIHIAISHLKLREEYLPTIVELHEKFGLAALHTTDSVPQVPAIKNLDFIKVHPLARRFASTINKLHYNQSVSDLFGAKVRS